jgi:predicted nucleic acid-binding protein
MKEKVYIETSIVSYLISKSNRDIVISAKQELTKEWWNEYSGLYKMFVSDLVINEISQGDPLYSKQRLKIVNKIPILETTEQAINIAKVITDKKILPVKATDDILHIAIAITHGIDYLLTWNCKHIANAHIIKSIESIAKQFNKQIPVLCTPLEILGGNHVL